MIHNLHITSDFISSPVFVPHQLQHNTLFHAFTTLPHSCRSELCVFATRRHSFEVSENLSTLKSAVFTPITCSPTECYIFLTLLFITCFFNFSTFYPFLLKPKIEAESSSETLPTYPLPLDQD